MEMKLYLLAGEELERIHGKLDQIIKALEVNFGPQETKTSKKWLTTAEVAELLHVTPRCIQDWRDNGRITFVKLGRRILYNSEDIAVLLQKHHIKRYRH